MHRHLGHWWQRGFTLIEGLITSVIVAILAAVAIPMYLGYVESQKRSTVESLAQSAAVSANAMYRRGVTPTDANVRATLFLPNPTAYNVLIDQPSAGRLIVNDAANTAIADTVNYR